MAAHPAFFFNTAAMLDTLTSNPANIGKLEIKVENFAPRIPIRKDEYKDAANQCALFGEFDDAVVAYKDMLEEIGFESDDRIYQLAPKIVDQLKRKDVSGIVIQMGLENAGLAQLLKEEGYDVAAKTILGDEKQPVTDLEIIQYLVFKLIKEQFGNNHDHITIQLFTALQTEQQLRDLEVRINEITFEKAIEELTKRLGSSS